MSMQTKTVIEIQDGINANVITLVTFSTLLQCIALLGVLPIADNTFGRHIFSTVEMLLILLLLLQGLHIRQWSIVSNQDALVQKIASLCFYSLLLCGIGDFVNRNYFEHYYQWDTVIKHGYLINSILFFFPGYSLVIIANWQISKQHISGRAAAIGIVIAVALGALIFLSNYDPRVSAHASSAMFLYTLMHAFLIISTLSTIKVYGWSASCIVAIGALLATLADALLAHFMIYRDYYPAIEHANFIIYFTSLAMIQQMPFMVARRAKLIA